MPKERVWNGYARIERVAGPPWPSDGVIVRTLSVVSAGHGSFRHVIQQRNCLSDHEEREAMKELKRWCRKNGYTFQEGSY